MENREQEFPPVMETKKPFFKSVAEWLTGVEARKQQQDLENIGTYAGLVRSVNEKTLQLSTSWQGSRVEQNLLAGACRLALETDKIVLLGTTQEQPTAISPEFAKTVLTGICMSFPDEMHGERLINGQPSRETLKHCAACVVAIMTHDGDDDTRFYDSVMSGEDIRRRFIEMQSELGKKA